MDCNTAHENNVKVELNFKISDKVLVKQMAFSTNQKAFITVILGLSQQFIQMEQSGFSMEQNL